jgi:hypothetical protein
MWSERGRNFVFGFSYFRRLIDILLTAIAAGDRETVINEREGLGAVSSSQRDLMAFKETTAKMKPTILAKHYPAIIFFYHHSHLLWPNALIGGKSTAGRTKLQNLNSKLGLPTKVSCRPPSDYLELAVTLCAEKRAGG